MADDGPARGPDPEVPAAPADDDSLRCSFCGKDRAEVDAIICGPTPAVAICSECVDLCTEVLAEARATRRR